MRRQPSVLLSLCLPLLLVASGGLAIAGDGKQTVCTITVNSDDEREAFRRHLPADRFEFVELVENGRPDWLASACRKRVQCDVLLISGHFDDGSEFYSDRLDSRDRLPVAELERAACSAGCSSLFSQLKEVYLFGCNTLGAGALRIPSGEAVRSLVRAGHTPLGAAAFARELEARHGESNRDRMRVVFKDVPVIYGFASKAPLGARAGPLLERWFRAGGAADVAQSRGSARLLALFAPVSMQVAAGVHGGDSHAGHRDDVCRFVDDRQSVAERLRFVHALMKREMAEVQMYLDRLDTLTAPLPGATLSADAAAARAELADDADAQRRFLVVARDADDLATASRMLDIAQRIGWLSADRRREEFVRVVDARARRGAVGAADIDVICASNVRRELDSAAAALNPRSAYADTAGNAAALACLGHPERRARALRALTSDDEQDARIAQVYLRYQPVDDVAELRSLTAAVARMSGGGAQVRALDALAALRVADRESLDTLARLYPRARSPGIQRAIAGVLIRADYRSIADPELVRALREHRLAPHDGEDLIDVLIRRLEMAS
jgi:hypothetical protein